MADAQKTIDLIFNGVDKTGAAVQGVLNNTKSLSTNVQSATQPFANASAAALKYEAALLATGAAITAFSVKAAGDFDTGFREIASLLDEPIEALDEFRQGILDYAAGSSSSLEQVNSAIYSAISAGVDYTDSLEAVRVAEQLAIAGRGELDETLTLLVSSLNAYGLSTDEAARFSDALFTTVRNGQTTLPELNANLQAVTGTAATLNVPFEEILAALSALTASGTPTAQAVTQINAVLSALLKPSSQAAAEAERLGIEFSAQSVQANGLQKTLQDVFEATGGNEEVMARLFPRVEALRAVFPLTGIAAEKFADDLNSLESSAGATEAAYEKLAGGLDQIAGRLASSFEVLAVSIGSPLLDDVGGVADAIGAIFAALGDSFNEGELRQITQFVEDEFAGLAETLRGVAAALPEALSAADLSGFTDGLEVVRDAIGSLFGDLDLTQADDLARAITFIGNAFEGLSQFSAGIVESFGPLVQKLAEIAEKATAAGGPLKELGGVFGIASQVNIFAGAIGGLTGQLEILLNILILRQGAGLVGGMKSFAGTIAGPAGLLSLLGKAGLVGAAGAAGFALGELGNKASEVTTGKTLSEWLADAAANATGLNDKMRRLGEDLTESTGPSAEQTARSIAELDSELASIGERGNTFNFSSGLSEVTEAAAQGAKNFEELDDAVNGNIATLRLYPEDIKPAADSLNKLGADGQSLTGTFSVVEFAATKATKSIQSLAGASEDLRAKAIIASIEGATDINVAKIEADAERAVAAYQSIDNAITSTGDSINSLFDTLASGDLSRSDEIDLEAQIRKEEKRRQQEFEQQKKLLDTEIALNKERAKRLRSGQSLINIDGAGLQPHLEAFMFEILGAIQVQVNAEGANLLLGLDQ